MLHSANSMPALTSMRLVCFIVRMDMKGDVPNWCDAYASPGDGDMCPCCGDFLAPGHVCDIQANERDYPTQEEHDASLVAVELRHVDDAPF
jgi:hypothetical protein